MTVNAPNYSYPQFSIPTAGRMNDQEPLIERHGLEGFERAEHSLPSRGMRTPLPKAKQSSGLLKKTLYALVAAGGIGALVVNHRLNVEQALAQQQKIALPSIPTLAAGGVALAGSLGLAHFFTNVKPKNIYSPPPQGFLQRWGITKRIGQGVGVVATNVDKVAKQPLSLFNGVKDLSAATTNIVLAGPVALAGSAKGAFNATMNTGKTVWNAMLK